MVRATSKISVKGQVVIPVSMQRQLNLDDGTTLELQAEDSTITLKKTPGWVEETRGSLPSNHGQIEPEQLEALIEAATLIESYQTFGHSK